MAKMQLDLEGILNFTSDNAKNDRRSKNPNYCCQFVV